MIRCLLFDLDGTLFDSRAANIAAYSQAFRDLGIPFNEEDYSTSFGLRLDEMLDKIAPATTPNTRSQIKALKAGYYKRNLDLVTPNTGLIELTKGASGKFLTGLITTASKVNVINLLDHFEVPKETFDVLLFGEDVKKAKPDPEAYLTAAQKLRVSPEECCVFEDSDIGIQAAKAAGMSTIRVTL